MQEGVAIQLELMFGCELERCIRVALLHDVADLQVVCAIGPEPPADDVSCTGSREKGAKF